ncbi:Sec-independent protein translocase subunit TatA [Streptomyces sp. TS71-3]|uniref:Sec-independent protein translocase subunit TatA n=1 Tax=Streptomyces sp. TS71-3 TaxID=2733862 RepID=UPI001B2CF336|nr:Sec-independent protein translocase subunit TatA [Streptomyces sp. TS71-3]GHJ38760.1 Sec-independent protein translocase protein TatA [Streptomyces sp. TS71-3]
MFGRLGAPEIILILVVIVLLFGAKKLPDMARSLGKSARILKSEAKAMKSEGSSQTAPADPPASDPSQRTIQAAPGDVSSSRPVSEPTDTTQR